MIDKVYETAKKLGAKKRWIDIQEALCKASEIVRALRGTGGIVQRQQSPTNGAYKAVSVRKGLPSSVNLTLPPLAVVILRARR